MITPRGQASPHVGLEVFDFSVGNNFVVIETFNDEFLEGAGTVESNVDLAVVKDTDEVSSLAFSVT